MKMKNSSGTTVQIKELGLVVKPGESVDIDDGYAMPGRTNSGSRKPSIIETLAPQMKPASHEEEKIWLQTPDTDNAVPDNAGPPSVTDLIKQGNPPAVAEHMAKRKRLEWEADQARKKAQSHQTRAESVEMEAAKLAAQEEQARKKYDEEVKEDEAKRAKLAKTGEKQLKEEADANAKAVEATAKVQAGETPHQGHKQ